MIESNRLTDPAQSSSGQLAEALPSAVTTPIADAAGSDAIARPRKSMERSPWRRAADRSLPLFRFVLYTEPSLAPSRGAFYVPHQSPSGHVSSSANHTSRFPEKRKNILDRIEALAGSGFQLGDELFRSTITRQMTPFVAARSAGGWTECLNGDPTLSRHLANCENGGRSLMLRSEKGCG